MNDMKTCDSGRMSQVEDQLSQLENEINLLCKEQSILADKLIPILRNEGAPSDYFGPPAADKAEELVPLADRLRRLRGSLRVGSDRLETLLNLLEL